MMEKEKGKEGKFLSGKAFKIRASLPCKADLSEKLLLPFPFALRFISKACDCTITPTAFYDKPEIIALWRRSQDRSRTQKSIMLVI